MVGLGSSSSWSSAWPFVVLFLFGDDAGEQVLGLLAVSTGVLPA